MKDFVEKLIETDVLIVGGGASGCFAAIRASEVGVRVTLIEKSAHRRCSCTGPGMDHFPNVPELRKPTRLRTTETTRRTHMGVANPHLTRLIHRDAYKRVLDLERFGVKMRQEDETFKVVLPAIGELAFFGPNLQIKLAEAVLKHGVNVVERTMAVDLLTKGNRVIGVVGVNTRTGEIITVASKATILATGFPARVYIGYNGELFDTRSCAANDGCAQAMAYRAGAKVTGMEFAWVRPDLKNEKLMSLGMFTRYPLGLRGRVVNAKGEVLEKEMPESEFGSWRDGELIKLILDEEKEGRGPCYWDLTHVPDSQIKNFYWHIRSEAAIREEFQKDRGVLGMKKSKFMFEIKVKPSDIMGGILTDEDMRTSMGGLYAAGGAAGIETLTAATVTGYIAGESVAKDAAKIVERPEKDEMQIAQIRKHVLTTIKVTDGLNPIEFERKVRRILDEYAGIYKSEGMLKRGLELLEQIREKFMPLISARNPHESMRAAEVRNIWLVAKTHLKASLLREETRPYGLLSLAHGRVEYPEPKDELNKPIVIKKVDEKMALSWRDLYLPSKPA